MIAPLTFVLLLGAPDPAIGELKAGVQAFQAGRYADALRKLKRFEPDAARLGEEALTYWHIARALEELKRPCEALPYFEKTAQAPNSPPKATDKIEALRGSLRAGIRVECATPGTAVRLKGQAGELACPGQWTELEPGRYTVVGRVGGRDFAPVQTEATLCETQRVTIEAAGVLQIGSPTAGAQVSVDGVLAGPAPLEIDPIPPGRYLVEVSAPGHVTARRQATVESAGKYAHEVALEPTLAATTPPAPPPVGEPETPVIAWLATAAAVAAVGTGGAYLWLSSESRAERDDLRDAYNAETDPTLVEEKRLAVLDKEDEIASRRDVGIGLLVGGAALGGLATWLFLRDDDSMAFAPAPGGAVWTARW